MTKLQQQLAEQFLHILEEEKLDWKKEWSGLSGRPYNPVSKTVYHGSNYFSLLLTSMAKGYQDPRWCTFAQIKEQGWTLKAGKGQSAKIEFWYPYDREQKKAISWQEFREDGGQINERYQLFSRAYSVYNGDMIVGIPKLEVTQNEIQPVELVDTISRNMGVPISYHQTDRAFYRPVEDRIYLPYRQQFDSEYAYASTALHELSHATGSEHRLNRKQGVEFGTEPYAYEELVAEISSCFLSSELPIGQTEEHLKNHKAYVQSWIQGIKEQPEALFRAVKDAEQAAAYLEYHGGLITLEEYQTYGIEIEPAAQTRDPVPKFGTEETKKVAIESTMDYEDLDFYVNRYNEKGYGLEASPELEEAKRKIAAYEKSIGRTESMINRASTEQVLAYEKKCEAYLEFGNSVDRVLHPLEKEKYYQGKRRHEAILVCNTPEMIQNVGLRELPMHITQKHVLDCLHEKTVDNVHYHGLSTQELKRLPEALESPVILAESLTKDDSLVAVLDYREQDGNPVIVAVRPNGNAMYELRKVDSNFITSMYGKDNFSEFCQRILDQGKLLYANKENGEKLGYYLENQKSQIPEYDKILKKMALSESEQIKPKHIRRF
mgnify:CR=1 FL=1|jgi:antirestriction protein ArdC